MLLLWLLESVVKVAEIILLLSFCEFDKVILDLIIIRVTIRLEITIPLNRARVRLIY